MKIRIHAKHLKNEVIPMKYEGELPEASLKVQQWCKTIILNKDIDATENDINEALDVYVGSIIAGTVSGMVSKGVQVHAIEMKDMDSEVVVEILQ